MRPVSSTARLVDELWAHLAMEYSGAVAPGRILAFVVRAERGLRGLELELGSRLDLIESSVRRQLAHATARPMPEGGPGLGTASDSVPLQLPVNDVRP